MESTAAGSVTDPIESALQLTSESGKQGQGAWALVFSEGTCLRTKLAPGVWIGAWDRREGVEHWARDKTRVLMGGLKADSAHGSRLLDAFVLQLLCWSLDVRLVVLVLGGDKSLMNEPQVATGSHYGKFGRL